MVEFRKYISRWNFERLEVFLLPVVCFVVYLPALHHDFVLDDRWLVIENPYIKSWSYLPQMLSKDAWNIWHPHNYWRPVFTISLAIDYSIWGLNPFGFHLTNILLHVVNAAFLYSLCKRLQYSRCAVFASVLFALHPIQTHTVSVISTRGDLLAALFTLGSLSAFLSRRRILCVTLMTLALLSKETSTVLPVVLVSAGLLLQTEYRHLRQFMLSAFAVLAVYLVVRVSLGFSYSLPPTIFSYQASSAERVFLAFKVLPLYFLAIFNLFELPHPFWTVQVPSSLGDPYVVIGILVSLLLLGAIWGNLKKNPLVAFGLLWFVIYFLPISNLKQLNQPMAEHWLYIPMMGLSVTFGAALEALHFRFSGVRPFQLGVTTGFAVFLIFGALVVKEKSRIYQDEETFLLAGARANPQIAKLYSMLGSIYLARQDVPRAKEFYAKALRMDPNDFVANYRMGFLFHQTGQYDEAKSYLDKVVRSTPGPLYEVLPVAHAWEMLGDKQKALFYYRKALDLNPQSVRTKEKVASLENAQ